MSKPRLHLDADISLRALQKASQDRNHDVSRMPNEWMPLNANDKEQLLGASTHGRIILTFNIADFVQLSREYPQHGGIVLANQRLWTLSSLIAAVDRLLQTTEAEEWIGQVRWLSEWRENAGSG